MKATLKNYRQSPRKVRLVANVVKGKKVTEALEALDFINKRANLPIKKLIASALANAIFSKADTANLYVKDLTVNKGIVMKRAQPMARGRAFPIRKKTSIITVVLDIKTENKKKVKKAVKTEAVKVTKVVKKTTKTKKETKE